MPQFTSRDAEIFYQVLGDGPPVVLLHPFPVHHEFWLPVALALQGRYRLILPDLRGHGASGIGDGPATMEKHAEDLVRLLEDAGVGRAVFVGVSIGGYVLFELLRRYRNRVSALVLCNTKPQADTPEARAIRLQAAADVLERGTEVFFESMLPKLISRSTHSARPDLVLGAFRMMRKMSTEDVAMVQRGMADRPDSVSSLAAIKAPTLILTGDEDLMTGVAEAEVMRKNIPGSVFKIIAKAGHYAAWERPDEVGKVLRQFLDEVHGG
jgi:pimeloyl-ACP methyl ester carboxylesterase